MRSLAFIPDGQKLASGGINGTLKLWNVRRVQVTRTLRGSGDVFRIAFSPDGQRLITATNPSLTPQAAKSIQVWTLDAAKISPPLGWKLPPDATVALHPHSMTYASASSQYGTILADLGTNQTLHTLNLYTSELSFSPDGQFLVALGKGGIEIWR